MARKRMECGKSWHMRGRACRAGATRYFIALLHERLALDLARFLIASLGAQRIGQQPSRLPLRGGIAARERERLAPAPDRLVRVVLREPQPSELDPQQGIVGLDAQRPLERRGGPVEVPVSGSVCACATSERVAGER